MMGMVKQFVNDDFCVNLFLAGHSIDGVANEIYLLLQTAYKDGMIEEKITRKAARRMAEEAIYRNTMQKREQK